VVPLEPFELLDHHRAGRERLGVGHWESARPEDFGKTPIRSRRFARIVGGDLDEAVDHFSGALDALKGMWMGGVPPLGYRTEDRKLVVIDSEAESVRAIFCRYVELGSIRLLKEELEARGINSKSWTSASGRRIGGKPFSRGALYLILQNRTYLGEIVHKRQSHPGEHTPIIDQPLWDAVQAQLSSNTAGRSSGTRTRQPSLLAGMLFDGDGNPMTPIHAVKKGTRYRYYVSRPLITKDRSDESAGLRLPAEAIEQLVTGRVRQLLLDPGSFYPVTPRTDPSAQRRLIARAAEIGKSWPQLPATRQRALLAGLVPSPIKGFVSRKIVRDMTGTAFQPSRRPCQRQHLRPDVRCAA
jgi:site-specific DNA recombinase